MDVTVRITGIDDVQARLDRIKGVAWARAPMNQSVLLLQNRLAQYPPQRPGSRYVRGRGTMNAAGVVEVFTSENLGKSWTTDVQVRSDTVTGRVGSAVSYAPFVQSRALQAWVHRGRWKTEADIAQEETDRIVDFFRAAIERVTR